MLSEIENSGEKALDYLENLAQIFLKFLNNQRLIKIIKDSPYSFLLNMVGSNLSSSIYNTSNKEESFNSNASTNYANVVNQAFILDMIRIICEELYCICEKKNKITGEKEIKFSDIIVFLKLKETKGEFWNEENIMEKVESLLIVNNISQKSNSTSLLYYMKAMKIHLKFLKQNFTQEINRILLNKNIDINLNNLSNSVVITQLDFEDFLTKVMKNSKQESLNELLNYQLAFFPGKAEKEREKESNFNDEIESCISNPNEKLLRTSNSSNISNEQVFISCTSFIEILYFIQEYNKNSLSVLHNTKLIIKTNGKRIRKLLVFFNYEAKKTYGYISKNTEEAYKNFNLKQSLRENYQSMKSYVSSYYDESRLKSAYLRFKDFKNNKIPETFNYYYDNYNLKKLYEYASSKEGMQDYYKYIINSTSNGIVRIKETIHYDALQKNILNNINFLINKSGNYYTRMENLCSNNIKKINDSTQRLLANFCSDYLIIETDEATGKKKVNFRESAKLPAEKAKNYLILVYDNLTKMNKSAISKYHKFLVL